MLLRRTYTREEVRDSKTVAANIARGPVEAAASDALVTGDAAAVQRMDSVVRGAVLDPVVVAVKLWTGSGRIVYSTDTGQIGTIASLDPEDTSPLRTGAITTDISDRLGEADDAPERALHRHLLEVYLPVHTPSGTPLLLEAYVQFTGINHDARSILLDSLPTLIGALVLLELIQLPLALSLARRVQRAEHRQDELLERALAASDTERKRIAGDLHDGVVQDLAALNFTLTEAADMVDGDADPALSAALRQGASTTRRSIQALRSLFVNIYPPNLREAGLPSALGDLVSAAARNGTEVDVQVAPDLSLSDRTETLIYRTAQEAVRNALQHAHARHVGVTVSRAGDQVVLEVVDDGRGFTPASETTADGHLGLRLMSEFAADLHGSLSVESEPGAGTRVRLAVPA